MIDPGTQPDPGAWMHDLIRELYPWFRGLMGDGNRRTLAALSRHVPLRIHEVPTGSVAFDWTVPSEWRFRDAYVKDCDGRRVIDARKLNLHVPGRSRPVHRTMTWAELRPRLHTISERPDWIPYRHHALPDSPWAFCVSQNQLEAIEREGRGPYQVCIDADFVPGALTYGEAVVPGASSDQVLISSHLCHPSLCNDNLSGVAVAAAMARRLMDRKRRYTYRFVFAPATLGAVVFLSRAGDSIRRVRHGLVLTGVGDPGSLTYKCSRRGDAPVDVAAGTVVQARGGHIRDFSPTGYDERQYGSPGFNLPMGTLMRSEPGTYPQYHTSADDPDFVTAEALADSLDACEQIMARLEALPAQAMQATSTPECRCRADGVAYRNLSPFGEPQLSRRGVFDGDSSVDPIAAMWVLNLSDGRHDLDAIAARSGVPLVPLRIAADALVHAGLLEAPAAAEHEPELIESLT